MSLESGSTWLEDHLQRQPKLLGIDSDYYVKLDAEDQELLQRLSDWPIEKLLLRSTRDLRAFDSIKEYFDYCLHYKRYMFFKGRPKTSNIYPDNVHSMYSHKLDLIWHSHILFTKEYRDFYQEVFGAFVDHIPFHGRRETPRNPNREQWRSEYKQAFGELPPDFNPKLYERPPCG